MVLMSFERSRSARRVDFTLHGAAGLMLALILLTLAPRGHGPALGATVLAGVAGWAGVERLLHRWVLHGMRPFGRWHARHGHPPLTRLCTPAWLSTALFIALLFLPALAVAGVWHASAATLGCLACATAHRALQHGKAGKVGPGPRPQRRGLRLALMQLKHGLPRSA